MAYRLGIGEGSNPGPGFAAFGMASLLGILSLGLIVKNLLPARGRMEKNQEATRRWAWGKTLLVLLILAGFGAFFSTLGLPLSTFLLMLLLVWIVGRQKLKIAFATALLTAGFAYLLFVVLLRLPVSPGEIWLSFGD